MPPERVETGSQGEREGFEVLHGLSSERGFSAGRRLTCLATIRTTLLQVAQPPQALRDGSIGSRIVLGIYF